MGNLVYEFNGVIFHEMTHVWQWNGNGGAPSYAPGHRVKNGEGNRWDQGYDVTAQFLDYCESVKTGFVADLNRKMRFGYSVNFFKDITGRTVDQLWRDYKAKFGKFLGCNSFDGIYHVPTAVATTTVATEAAMDVSSVMPATRREEIMWPMRDNKT
ncbi:hypothetical protein Pyn_01284 [Prunus yedoensis var. nudiflora]|uniref:Basic secretory protease n=1 Tax=Prunus yedoensis var. nudiflora TaxID=2094558 RepID=A0A314ZLA0_PRUYE|nr:hypothetical protein Pyn_01284 [Prunus yedoensis var. nudiflora]